MTFILIPIAILLAILLLFGLILLLGRFRGGRYLRPIVATLAKIGFMRRMFERLSRAAIERQNPELASALRKMQRAGVNPDPQRAQQALSQLSAAERRAYLDAVQEQGAMPEPANRQMRRAQQRLEQGSRAGGGGSGSGSGAGGKRSGKRKR